jgi:hypothetical protein
MHGEASRVGGSCDAALGWWSWWCYPDSHTLTIPIKPASRVGVYGGYRKWYPYPYPHVPLPATHAGLETLPLHYT